MLVTNKSGFLSGVLSSDMAILTVSLNNIIGPRVNPSVDSAQVAEVRLKELQDNWVETRGRSLSVNQDKVRKLSASLTAPLTRIFDEMQLNKGGNSDQSFQEKITAIAEQVASATIRIVLKANNDQLKEIFGLDTEILQVLNKVQNKEELNDEDNQRIVSHLKSTIEVLPAYVKNSPANILKVLEKSKSSWQSLELFKRVNAYLNETLALDDGFDSDDLFNAVLYSSRSNQVSQNLVQVIKAFSKAGVNIVTESKELKKQYLIAVYNVAMKGKNVTDVIEAYGKAGIEWSELSEELKKQYLIAVYKVAMEGKNVTDVIEAYGKAGIKWEANWSDELKKPYLIAVYVVAMNGKNVDDVIRAYKNARIKWEANWSDELKKQYLIAVYAVAMKGKNVTEVIEAYGKAGIKWEANCSDELKKQCLIAVYQVAMEGKNVTDSIRIIGEKYADARDIEMRLKLSWRLTLAGWTLDQIGDTSAEDLLRALNNEIGPRVNHNAAQLSIEAETQKGGIDLTVDLIQQTTQIKNNQIEFKIDSAQLALLKNAPGFYPVIDGIQYINSSAELKNFLGVN